MGYGTIPNTKWYHAVLGGLLLLAMFMLPTLGFLVFLGAFK